VIFLQPDFLEGVQDSLTLFFGRADFVNLQPLADRVSDPHSWVQRRVGILEDDLHLATNIFERLTVELQ